MATLNDLFNKSFQRREKLSSMTNALRLVNGAGDGLDGLFIDRYHKHLPELLGLAASVLNPGGRLLVTTNYSGISHVDLEEMLNMNLQGRPIQEIKRVGQDMDFMGSNSFKESYLAGLWVKFL